MTARHRQPPLRGLVRRRSCHEASPRMGGSHRDVFHGKHPQHRARRARRRGQDQLVRSAAAGRRRDPGGRIGRARQHRIGHRQSGEGARAFDRQLHRAYRPRRLPPQPDRHRRLRRLPRRHPGRAVGGGKRGDRGQCGQRHRVRHPPHDDARAEARPGAHPGDQQDRLRRRETGRLGGRAARGIRQRMPAGEPARQPRQPGIGLLLPQATAPPISPRWPKRTSASWTRWSRSTKA